MKSLKTFTFLTISLSLLACVVGDKDKGKSTSDYGSDSSSTDLAIEDDAYVVDDDYIGDDENRSYKLGKITFTAEGETFTINDFGIDPYTAMTWFTPESGVDPMANVVFKSSDFKMNTLVSFEDFDAMQNNYQGQKTIEKGLPRASFVNGDITYMFSEGKVMFSDFSRKTGKIKLKVQGKVFKSLWGNPSEMKTDLPASLEIDAYIPFVSIDGSLFKTEAAEKFNVHEL